MSTDFFGAFKYSMTRLTYSGGLITPSGSFYNGVWVDFGESTMSDNQFMFVEFSHRIPFIIILYNQSLYNTLLALQAALKDRDLSSEFIPPLVENESREYIGKILISNRTPLYPELISKAYISDISTIPAETIAVATVNNSPQSSSINGCIQPLKGSETMVLPEGLRDQEVYNLWTDTKLNIVGGRVEPQGFGTYLGDSADNIIVNGEVYTVYTAKPWVYVPIMGPIGGVSQYQYYITRYQPLFTLPLSAKGEESPELSLR